MHIPQFTYFNVVVQCCQRHALSLGARSFSALRAAGITSKLGEKKVRHAHLCVSACCVVFNQEHWKRWIETQQENKKPPDALTSMSFPHITGCLFVLQPLVFLYYCWRERCWLRCCILLSHLWSWLLHESGQRGEKGTANRHLLSLVNFWLESLTTLCFCSSAGAGWTSLEENAHVLD